MYYLHCRLREKNMFALGKYWEDVKPRFVDYIVQHFANCGWEEPSLIKVRDKIENSNLQNNPSSFCIVKNNKYVAG